jgi:hypothetical protein
MASLLKDVFWLFERECDDGAVSSFHQPALFVAAKSGEAEKEKSSAGEASGPHVVIGRLWVEGGVCKAERAALEVADELKVKPMLSPNRSLLGFEFSIDGDACGVSW